MLRDNFAPAKGTVAAPLRPLGMSVKDKPCDGEHRPGRGTGQIEIFMV